MVKIKYSFSFLLSIWIIISFVCINSVAAEELLPVTSGEEIWQLLTTEGLTCRVQKLILALDNNEQLVLRETIAQYLADDDIQWLINSREQNCPSLWANTPLTTSSGNKMFNAAPSYKVERIEETSGNGGYSATAIYIDSASSGWMCNGGQPATWYDPADYIALYTVPNSYTNLSKLKIRGTNWWASCYITGYVDARVYTDNTIKACIGALSVFGCFAVTPFPQDTKIWIQQ